jgi:hypothetical protein
MLKVLKNDSPSDFKEQALAHCNLSKPKWIGMTRLPGLAGYGKSEPRFTDAELLIENGTNIEAIDEEDTSTPLAWATKQGRTGMVALLLDKGANPHG